MREINYPEGFFDFGSGLENSDSEVREMIRELIEHIQSRWAKDGFRDEAIYSRSGRTFVGVFAYLEDAGDLSKGLLPKFALRVFVMQGGESLTIRGYTPSINPGFKKVE
jgi:hypothetical protein